LLSLQPGEYRLYSQNQNLSTNTLNVSQDVKLYPNPVIDTFSVNKDVNNISIYNITGKLVKTFEGHFSKNHAFNISSLPPSVYIVKMENNLETQNTFKIIKLN